MENSLASYLTPLFLKTENGGFRFFYDGKHVWDVTFIPYHGRLHVYVKNPMGKEVHRIQKYVRGEGYITQACDPYHSPLSQVIADHFKDILSVNEMEIGKFQVRSLNVQEPKNDWTHCILEGDHVEIAWDKPWNMDTHSETLRSYCREDSKNLSIVLQQLFKGRFYKRINGFLKGGYSTRGLNISINGSPSFVILNSGALYDYRRKNILSENLQVYMKSVLQKNEITWDDYSNHMIICGVPLKLWLSSVDIKQTSIDQSYFKHYWSSVKSRTLKEMPILQSIGGYSTSSSSYGLELFAFNSVEACMESYSLDKMGFRRTFEKAPRPAVMTQEQKDELFQWTSQLSKEIVAELLARPGVSWFGRLKGRYWNSPLEPVKVVL